MKKGKIIRRKYNPEFKMDAIETGSLSFKILQKSMQKNEAPRGKLVSDWLRQ